MPEQSPRPLFTGLVVVAAVLFLGGLVAWGAGYFESDAAATTPDAAPMQGSEFTLPPSHPPLDGMTASPGPIRPAAPAGACPAEEKVKKCDGSSCKKEGGCEKPSCDGSACEGEDGCPVEN